MTGTTYHLHLEPAGWPLGLPPELQVRMKPLFNGFAEREGEYCANQAGTSCMSAVGSVWLYYYDWNLAPPAALAEGTGDLQAFPPMQDPSSYNLDQIITEMKNSKTASHAGE